MIKITKLVFRLIFAVFFASITFAVAAQKPPSKPNVVLIYVDDLGYGDVSYYGATSIQTPNVDALAKEGLRFTNGHCTSATCTPSRYALLTGQYPWRKEGTGILEGDAPLIISTEKITLPKVFQKAGYKTGVVGKWHLGLGDKVEKDWNGTIKPRPNEVGFDYSFIFPATADRVPTVFMEDGRVIGLDQNDPLAVDYKRKIGNEPTGAENPELLKMTYTGKQHSNTIVNGISRIGFMTGGKLARWADEELGPVFLTQAQKFIETHKDSPFFLYYSLHNIHAPRMPSTMFKGKSILGYRGDAILEMDWAVGEITRQLKALGIDKNTIIIFSSDNGPVLHDAYNDYAIEKNGSHKAAGPFKGGKYTVWEGGTRIPFIVRWPEKIKAGSTSAALVSQQDLLASFSAFFNQPLPASEAGDSQNLWTDLIGKTNKGRACLVEQGLNDIALLSGSWKFIPSTPKTEARLFDLSKDLHEDNNLAKKYPEKVKKLIQMLDTIRGEVKALQ